MDNISSNTIDDLISNRKYFAQITQEFLKTISLERIPLFSSIEIETMNRCNGKCTFCPVNHDIDPRKFSRMSEPLFQKIIDELKTLNYSGRLALYSNNEPFLDVRIEDFARYARSALPRACIYIYTNGTVLNKTRLERILPSLDYMIIDNYDDNGIITDSIRQLIESCKSNTEFSKKVKISMRKQNEVLFSRGGNAPNKKIVQPLQMSCILPFKQIIIRPDGKLAKEITNKYNTINMIFIANPLPGTELSKISAENGYFEKEMTNSDYFVAIRANQSSMIKTPEFDKKKIFLLLKQELDSPEYSVHNIAQPMFWANTLIANQRAKRVFPRMSNKKVNWEWIGE